MDWTLSLDELRDYADRYWDMARMAEAEGTIELADEFRGIARDAESELTLKTRSAA